MNNYFLPNIEESDYISKLSNAFDQEYTCIRLTKTMVDKSIIDASAAVRYLLEKDNIVAFEDLKQGDKVLKNGLLFFGSELIETKVSYYRPKTKKGDPRFWIYALTKYSKEGDLLYLTVLNQSLIIVPFSKKEGQLAQFTSFTEKSSGEAEILALLKVKLEEIKTVGWTESVSSNTDNPKDVGDTLEKMMGIDINNLKTPDFMGKIELKSKRVQAKTLDTLFGKVPDWDISKHKSVLSIVDRYGYITEDWPMKRLYNNISSKPNAQGLYNMPDDNSAILFQKFKSDNLEEEVCAWRYSTIRNTLNQKHPTTLWVKAETRKLGDKFYFKYTEFELSTRPNFSEFIRLIWLDKIIFDWKSKIKMNGTSIRNHGPGFRIKPKDKKLLFHSLIELK